MRQKMLAIVLSLAMAVSMNPAMSFAGTGGAGGAPDEAVSGSVENAQGAECVDCMDSANSMENLNSMDAEVSSGVELAANRGTGDGNGSANAWDISATSGDQVFAWFAQTGATTYTLHIEGKGNMKDFNISGGTDDRPYASLKTGITAVVFETGSQVSNIGGHAFYGFTGLTGTFTIPASVKEIGEFAFNGSTITDVVIPSGVTTIEEAAFYSCSYLLSADIPEGVTTIEDRAFSDCPALKSVTIPSTVTNLGVTSGASIQGIFYNCIALESITISEGVKTIGIYTFLKGGQASAGGVTSVVIPKTVTQIGTDAFMSCNKLKYVTLPGATLGTNAFNDCPLKCVVIHDGVSSVDLSTLGGISTCKNLAVPVSLNKGTATLSSVMADIALTGDWSAESSINTGFNGKNLYWMPDSTKSTAAAFSGVKELNDAGGRMSIATAELDFLTALCMTDTDADNSVDIPVADMAERKNLVVNVGSGADRASVVFNEAACDNIAANSTGNTSVRLTLTKTPSPTDANITDYDISLKGVTTNTDIQFGTGGGSARITLPKDLVAGESVTVYYVDSIGSMTNMNAIHYEETVSSVTKGFVRFDTTHCSTYRMVKSGTATISPPYNGSTAIAAAKAAYGVTSGTLWWIGKDNQKDPLYAWVTGTAPNYTFHINGSGEMGDYTVSTTPSSDKRPYSSVCNDISSIVFEPGCSATSIGNYAFYQCTNITGSLTIPDSVTSIGDFAFYQCRGITGSLTIPGNVTSIGAYAFYQCSGITGSLTISEGVEIIENSAFMECTGITGSLSFPDSLTDLGDFTFSECINITGSLNFPDSITKIGNGVFRNTGIEKVIITDNVTEVGKDAFNTCGNLRNVYIGRNVTQINPSAFSNCTKLESLVLPASATSIDPTAFSGISSKFSIALSGNWSGMTSLPTYLSSGGALYGNDFYWYPGCVKNNEIFTAASQTEPKELYDEGGRMGITVPELDFIKVLCVTDTDTNNSVDIPVADMADRELLIINTGGGTGFADRSTVVFDKKACANIAANSTGNTVLKLTLTKTPSSTGANITDYDINLKGATTGTNIKFDGAGGGSAKIILPKDLTDGQSVKVFYLNTAKSSRDDMNATYREEEINGTDRGFVEFSTTHCSTYIMMVSDDYNYQAMISSPDVSVMTDNSVTLTVSVDAQSVFGAQYYINYDTSKFEFTGTSLSVSDYDATTTPGRINVAQVLSSTVTLPTVKTLATFNFRAKAQTSDVVNGYFTLNDMRIAPDATADWVGFTDAIPASVIDGKINDSENVQINYNTGLAAKLDIPTVNSRTFVYDGNLHVVDQVTTGDADVTVMYGTEEGSYIYDAAIARGVNAGTYPQYYRATEPGYVPVEDCYDLIILPKPLSVTWTNTGSKAYTGGQVQGPRATVNGLIGTDTAKYSVTGNLETEIGDYTAELEFDSGKWQDNYEMPAAEDMSKDWKIVKGASDNPTTVEVESPFVNNPTPVDPDDLSKGNKTDHYTVTYDGKTGDAAVVKTNGAQGENVFTWYVNNVDVGSEMPRIKDAGTYEISYNIKNSNYAEVNGAFTIVVNKYTVILEWRGVNDDTSNFNYTYDGEEHCPTAVVTNLLYDEKYNEDICNVTVTGGRTDSNWIQTGDGPDAGDYNTQYTASAAALSNPNYTLDGSTQKTHVFTIFRRNVTLTPDSNQSKDFGEDDPVFTGSITPTDDAGNGYIEKDLLGANVTFYRDRNTSLYSSGDVEAAGTHSKVIKADCVYNNNYRVVKQAADFTIRGAKANVLVDIAEDYIKGKTLVLAYLNSDRVACQYQGINMIELKNFGYTASDGKQYVHVFGLVVEGIGGSIGGYSHRYEAYAERVTTVLRDENSPYVEYSSDTNESGVLDANDVASLSGVYNNATPYPDMASIGFSMNTILRSNYVITKGVDATEHTNDNLVNTTDINRVHTEVITHLADK